MELGNTLAKIQALLKEMRAKTNSAKDPVAKANLEMWTLMLDQLDQQYEQPRVLALQRQDLQARRTALYKQADEKAAEAGKRAKAANTLTAGSKANSQTPATPSATPTTATRPVSSSSPN